MNLNEIVILNDCYDVKGYLRNKIGYLQGRNIDPKEINLILAELKSNGQQITACVFKDQNIARLVSKLETLL